MPDRGKLVVLGFFLLGLALAGGAMWYHFAKTRWAMAFWGTDAARLIVRAPEVEVWRLAYTPSEAENPSLHVGEQTLFVTDRRNLAKAKGLIHMRTALVEDASFDTTAQAPATQTWDYAFRFSTPKQVLTVAIDSKQGLASGVGETPRPIATLTPISAGLKRFLEEQFEEAATPGDETQIDRQ